jgi:hypothetical protein
VCSAKRRIQKSNSMKEYFGAIAVIKEEILKDLLQKDVGLRV